MGGLRIIRGIKDYKRIRELKAESSKGDRQKAIGIKQRGW